MGGRLTCADQDVTPSCPSRAAAPARLPPAALPDRDVEGLSGQAAEHVSPPRLVPPAGRRAPQTPPPEPLASHRDEPAKSGRDDARRRTDRRRDEDRGRAGLAHRTSGAALEILAR